MIYWAPFIIELLLISTNELHSGPKQIRNVLTQNVLLQIIRALIFLMKGGPDTPK